MSAGVSGFVAAAVIGPRLQRDREIDAPNNVAMVAVGAGLLWMGWNGFNGGDPYFAGASASAADAQHQPLHGGRVPGLGRLGLPHRPQAGAHFRGQRHHRRPRGNHARPPVTSTASVRVAIAASSPRPLVYFALNYMSRARPFRNVDDTLGVFYTHGLAGLLGGLLTGIFASSAMTVYQGVGKTASVAAPNGLIHGNWNLLKWQAIAAAFVIAWSAIATFILLKIVGLFIPLRMSEENMEIGDTAEHGHEVYPADIPSLGYPNGIPGLAAGAGQSTTA